MDSNENGAVNVVTGVFSYTGGYIARELLARGERVRTLSRRPEPGHPLAAEVALGTLQFDDEAALARDLEGAVTLYNTYWIRFPRGAVTWEDVVGNTRVLLRAARAAGVTRVVQFSVANASETSPYGYFRAKARAERALRESGISYAVVRPTLIFGRGEFLLENIAWALRRFPFFLVPGGEGFRVQPVSATEVARLAVELAGRRDDVVADAAGPVVYTLSELVGAVRGAVGATSRLVRCPAGLVLAAARLGELALGDVLVTREELGALRSNLLTSNAPAVGTAHLEDWLAAEAERLGRAFASERRRNW